MFFQRPVPRTSGSQYGKAGLRVPMTKRFRAAVPLAALAFALTPGLALAAPPTPVYTNPLGDCVTGNNQFYEQADNKFHWWVNQKIGADGANTTIKCDSHPNDQYERPTDATYGNNTISQKPGVLDTYLPPASPSRSPVPLGARRPTPSSRPARPSSRRTSTTSTPTSRAAGPARRR